MIDSIEAFYNIKSKLHQDKNFEFAQINDDVFALIKEKTPDIIVKEIVLKGEDWFELMEKYSKFSLKSKFFVVSSFS